MPKISQLVEIQEGALDSASLFVVVDNNSTLKITFGNLINNIEGLLDTSNIVFDNTASELVALNLKDAIDEIVEKFGTITVDYNNIDNTPDLSSLNLINYWKLLPTVQVGNYCEKFVDLGDGILLANMYEGTLLKSADNGLTWTEVIDKDTSGWWLSEFYINDNKDIVIFGYAKVFKSTDMGTNWTETALTKFTTCGYETIARNGDTIIARHFVTPGNNIYRSTDFGETWTEVEVSAIDAGDSRVKYLGNSVFYLRSPQGNWYRSINDGETWTEYTEPSYMDTNIYLSPNEDIALMKDTEGGITTTYKSIDSGFTWNAVLTGSSLYGDIAFVTNDIIFNAAGNVPSFYYSLDGGDNWTLYDHSAISTETRKVEIGFMLQDGSIIAGGYYGTNEAPLISKDNCATWELMTGTGLEDNDYCDGIYPSADGNGVWIMGEWPDPYGCTLYKYDKKYNIQIPFTNITDVPAPVNDGYLKRTSDGTGFEWVTGASGSFTSADGKTITVTNGLITSIV